MSCFAIERLPAHFRSQHRSTDSIQSTRPRTTKRPGVSVHHNPSPWNLTRTELICTQTIWTSPKRPARGEAAARRPEMVQDRELSARRGGRLVIADYLQLHAVCHQKRQGCLLGCPIGHLPRRVGPRLAMGAVEMQSGIRRADGVSLRWPRC